MMDIVACFDHGFVMPTGVMVYSVCANNADVDIVFHLVVDESVTENDKKDLVTTITAFQGKQVRFYEVSSQRCAVYPLLKAERLTRATYYRLFLAEILPSTVDKVLYLDGDCIVRHSLSSLWNTDLSAYAVGVAPAKSENDMVLYKRLDYPAENGYFNAGVMLINLEYWRQHDVTGQFVGYIGTYSDRIKWEDQDVLNVLFHDKKLTISLKYNLQTGFLYKNDAWHLKEDVAETIKDPVIVHYSAVNKPWLAYSRCPHPFVSTFLKYQNLTKWKGVRYEKRTVKQQFKNYIGDFLREIGFFSPRKNWYVESSPLD